MEEYPKKQADQRSSLPNDLFAASLQQSRSRSGESPWRLQSQIWIAFFGGAMAVAAIAYLNGHRLGLNKAKQQQILLAGILSVAITLISAVIFSQIEVAEMWRPGESGFRIVSRAIALITYLVLYQLQKSGYRIYVYHYGREFDSLWKAGLIAIFGLGTLQNLLVIGINALLGEAG